MSHLLIIVRERPVLELRDEDAPERLEVDGVVYHEVRSPGALFLGFYDWLRSSDRGIRGLRITFHDGREQAVNALRETGIGEWDGPWIYELVLDDTLPVNPQSVDQEFAVSRLYTGPAGQVALLMDIAGVGPEIAALVSSRR